MRIVFSAVIIAVLIAGCGFHLRGANTGLDASIERVALSAENAYGAFVQMLQRSLEQSGIEVARQESEAPYAIHVLDERVTRRAVATTSQVRVSEYEVRMEVRFELVDSTGSALIEPANLVAERIYSFDSSSLVGSSEEEELLKEEMRRDLAGQIIRRVNATIRASKSNANEQP